MKKLISLALALALTAGLCVPALAAEGDAAAGRAAAVTLAVKEKLDLDTGAYTEFNSSFSENVLEPTWRLYWSGDAGSLSISVTEEGRVESYSRYSYGPPVVRPVVNRGRFTPSFPVLTRDMARETALAFLDKVLEADETVELEGAGKSQLGASSYSFSGTILVNGLPSPFSFSVRVGENNAVTSFYRSGTGRGSILEDVPAPDAAVIAPAAGAALRDTFSFRLEYVLADDGKSAVLRYLPQSTHDFYVDARTGELVDLTALYNSLSPNQMTPEVSDRFLTADNSAKGELTPAELEGVAKLEGVLSKEALDAALRKLTDLGLDKYALGNVSYSVNSETGEVTAWLQYTRQVGESFWRRTVTADGKTAELKSVSSSFPWNDDGLEPTLSAAQAQARAESFLAAQCGEKFAKTALYNGESALAESAALSRGFTYVQKENGYFFPTNSLTVGVDCTDGSICTYYDGFDYDVPFASPEGIVDLEAAKDAWLGTYDVKLQYLAVPKVLDPSLPEYKALTDQGYSYLYTLELAYQLERGSYARGVDAHTGEALVSAPAEEKLVSYGDLDGHWIGEKAQRLALFNVGWLGGSMEPDKALTQIDLVALLVSTNGYLFDPGTDDADDLYRYAYSMGILTEDQRDDTAAVDRCELVKLLLDCTGYGDVAQIPGIFRCDFADAGDIPTPYLGYVALAWGLGLVEGDSGDCFCPASPATRAEAAAVLYRYLDR